MPRVGTTGSVIPDADFLRFLVSLDEALVRVVAFVDAEVFAEREVFEGAGVRAVLSEEREVAMNLAVQFIKARAFTSQFRRGTLLSKPVHLPAIRPRVHQ